MKKILISLLSFGFLFVALPALAKTTMPAEWKPKAPDGYAQITWAESRGVVSFYHAPSGNGSLDFLTFVYLPYTQVQLIATSAPMVDWGPGQEPFATDTARDFAVARFEAESAKAANPDVSFFWNAPFFNVNVTTTDLSLALRSVDASGTPYINSGSRPQSDVAQNRRMLIVNNNTGSGEIADFDAEAFVNSTLGDQAVEGFAPDILKTDSAGVAPGRLYLGIRPGGKELVVYCSQQATPSDAAGALTAAGVPIENQMQLDGGGSAACGYNMPGQYFVEPNRTLPYLMGAISLVERGTITTEGLNIRQGPGTKYKTAGKFHKGDLVKVYAKKSGWLKISRDNLWVYAGYVKKTS